MHKGNDAVLNSDQTRQTGLPYTQVPSRLLSTKDAVIFVLINDRDVNNEFINLSSIATSADAYDVILSLM